MEVKLPVLEKDDNWEQQIDKLQEETSELIEEIMLLKLHPEQEQAKKVLGEALDAIQVIVGIIEDITEDHQIKLKEAELGHVKKLHERGWMFRKWLEIKEG